MRGPTTRRIRAGAPVRALAGLLFLLGGGDPARADVVVLDNGARFEGKVVAEDDRSVVLERQSGGSLSRITFERARVTSIERTAPGSDGRPAPGPGDPTGTPVAPAVAARDEWWLLESGGKILGSRRIVLVATASAGVPGWRLEERLLFLARPKFPAVRVQRVEEATADFHPTSITYAERGEADDAAGAPAYEAVRSGAVKDGVWEAIEQTSGGRTVTRSIELPARCHTVLFAREALARVSPRRPGLVDVPVVDSRDGEVRVVRAGFTSLAAGDALVREDVLRIEDGERVLESRWTPGDPPRCVREDVSPGVTARLVTEAQVKAALAPTVAAPAAPTLDDSPLTPGGRRDVVHPELGFAYTVPGASWQPEKVPPRIDEEGPRLVSRAASRTLMADLRAEWDPRGADPATSPEEPLLARLRRLAPDLAVVEPRIPLAGRAATVWLGLVGTRRGERLRMLLVAGDRGRGRATLLVTCPEASWPDAREALDAVVASFRWL